MSEKLTNLNDANTVDADSDYMYIVQYVNDATPHWESRKIVPEDLNWELVIDEDGSSITNWTSLSGTWSADAGGYLKQTDATAAYRGLKYTPQVYPGLGWVVQFDVRFPASATATRRAMVAPAGQTSLSSTHDAWMGLQENNDRILFQRGDQAVEEFAFTVDEDTWYTVRVEWSGATNYTLSVDGVRKYSIRIKGPASTQEFTENLILVNYTGEVHYRNIKAWRLRGPV